MNLNRKGVNGPEPEPPTPIRGVSGPVHPTTSLMIKLIAHPSTWPSKVTGTASTVTVESWPVGEWPELPISKRAFRCVDGFGYAFNVSTPNRALRFEAWPHLASGYPNLREFIGRRYYATFFFKSYVKNHPQRFCYFDQCC